MKPADIGTRRMTIEALKENEWLTWPAWLTKTEDAWPKAPEKLQFSVREKPEPDMEGKSWGKILVFQENESSAVILP